MVWLVLLPIRPTANPVDNAQATSGRIRAGRKLALTSRLIRAAQKLLDRRDERLGLVAMNGVARSRELNYSRVRPYRA